MEKKKEKIILYRESLLQSVLSDLFTFGLLCFTMWFNYSFVGGSHFLNAVILVMLLLTLLSRTKSKIFTSKEDLIAYLNSDIEN